MKSGFQAVFSDLSVTIQSPLNGAEWQAHFSDNLVILLKF